MQQIVQLNPEDDLPSLRARLDAAELSHIVLAVPRGCRALQSDRDVQLLRRAAEDTGIEIGFVTRDADIRERAAKFGFPVFHSAFEAQQTRWRMVSLDRDVPQAAPSRSFLPWPGSSGGDPADRMRQLWILVAIGSIVLFVMCLFGAIFMPAANIHLVPATMAFSISTEFVADPTTGQANSSTLSIPARRITREISGTAQFKTTTEKSVPNAPSTGTVIFSNQRTEETAIPQGTVVKTTGGIPIRFLTLAAVTLPAGINSRMEAPIQAVEPGPVGNVKELAINSIEGPLAISARVINVRPTVSGSLRPVKVVTADDKKKLETLLVQQVKQQSIPLLRKDLKAGEFLPPDSVVLDLGDEVYDHAVDEPADVLNLYVTGTAFGLAVDEEDAGSLARSLLQKQLRGGYALLPDGVKIEPLSGGKYQGVALRMPVKATGYATPLVDIGKLRDGIQGKTAEEATLYLQSAVSLAQPPDINITPAGWNRMSWLGFRIAIFVEPQAVGQK